MVEDMFRHFSISETQYNTYLRDRRNAAPRFSENLWKTAISTPFSLPGATLSGALVRRKNSLPKPGRHGTIEGIV